MKLKRFFCGLLSFAVLSTAFLASPLAVSAAREKADVIGTVNMAGSPDFDCDSIRNGEASQWRWLGYPESRMVMNYGSQMMAKYDGKMSLNIAMAVKGFRSSNSVHQILMGPRTGEAAECTELETAWYPYKLTADAAYTEGKLHMDEFFADKDTFIRMIEVSDAADAKLQMKATIRGITQNGNDLLVEKEDYWFVYKFLKLNEAGEVTGQYEPQVSGDKWSVEMTFDADRAKLAFSLTMLPKNVGDNSADSIQELADKTVAEGTNLNTVLAETKQFWDDTLAKVPAPQNFGVEGNKKNGKITGEDHRRSFYAAWAFRLQNIVEPTPENGYDYYQVTLGMASAWSNGAASAPNSCSWESMYDIQQLSYIEPEIAWDAMRGFIYSIDENGILDGECLPSQKAHTTWVCYCNMLAKYPEKEDELKEELKNLYPHLHDYLLWRAENPRWIHGANDFPNEKDLSFVTQWYSDVNYAVKIAEVIEKEEDIAVYTAKKEELAEKSRVWFFDEYDPNQPDSLENRIAAFCFINEDGTLTHSWPGSFHDAQSRDALTYVYEAMTVDFPKDLTDKLVHSYLAYTAGKEEEPLLGFDSYKYGDGCYTAYGLQEREKQYPELKGKWVEYVDAVLCNAIKNTEFGEVIRVYEDTTMIQGVQPSSFSASAVIDYTYMKNGLRLDMGIPVAIGDPDIVKTDKTDITVTTIVGTKPELPKTVTMEKDGKELEALAVWPDVEEEQYRAGGKFRVTGQIYGTGLEVTGTVKVLTGNETTLLLGTAAGIAAIAAAIGAIVISRKKRK